MISGKIQDVSEKLTGEIVERVPRTRHLTVGLPVTRARFSTHDPRSNSLCDEATARIVRVPILKFQTPMGMAPPQTLSGARPPSLAANATSRSRCYEVLYGELVQPFALVRASVRSFFLIGSEPTRHFQHIHALLLATCTNLLNDFSPT